MKKQIKQLVATGTLLLSVLAANAQSVSVFADYSVTSGDNTTFRIVNSVATSLTGLQLMGLGQTGNFTGLSGSIALPDIAAFGSYSYSFNGANGTVFQFDPDEGMRGAVAYTLTGTENGTAVGITFSPSSNDTAGFVPFLGNNAAGAETDLTVASIQVGSFNLNVTPSPEPSTLALAGLGSLSLLALRKRK